MPIKSVNPISEAFCKMMYEKPDEPYVERMPLVDACVEAFKLLTPAMEGLLKEVEGENENSIR